MINGEESRRREDYPKLRNVAKRHGNSWRMSSGVVDSSVILAMLRREPNADQFLADLDETIVSTVILGEVISKLVAIGMNVDDAWRDAMSVIDRVVSFDEH